MDAALVLLARMGLSPADLLSAPSKRRQAPTFAEYIPLVSRASSAGTRRAYGTYFNRITDRWGHRRAAEHLIAALRCLYRHAASDGYITDADNPALKVAKPRRLPSPGQTRRSGWRRSPRRGPDPVVRPVRRAAGPA